ncbi:hypothetical protein ACQ86B_17445 [Mycolicibacterium aichiense]|uniref:hypothetical protein n=1 Tax=Mycolicibacterium aichiense TaxID=1799 RepID=UPI003D66D9DD
MDAKQRAEYKRRRTVAIKKLRDAGFSEAEIQEAIAKIREELGVESKEPEHVSNLPAVIDSSGDGGSTRSKKRTWPKKPNRDENYRSTNKENVAQYDSKLASNPERRCVGTNQLGEPCRNFAIKGGRVCKFHGGATRHVKEKARIRVEMAADRLMGKLIEIAYDDTRPASVQLDAIKDSLNRAGLSKPAQVEVGPMTPAEEIFDDIFSGSREAYRNGTQDDSSEQIDYDPNELMNFAESESISDSPADHHSPRDAYWREQPTSGNSDYDRPAAPQAEVRSSRTRRPSPTPVTGMDAIRAANRANGVYDSDDQPFIGDYVLPPRRALPPGRG